MVESDMRALVAVCRHRPFNFGHVGWGYRHADGRWRIGAVEGVGWRPGNHNGFWDACVDTLELALDAFAGMRTQRAEYDAVKLLQIRENVEASPRFADEVAEWVRRQPYRVIDRNCMDSAYDILRAFASGYRDPDGGLGVLPKPEDRWLPNQWYDRLPTIEERVLPRAAAMAATTLVPWRIDDDSPVDTARTETHPPPWRIPGHDGYIPPRRGPTEEEAARGAD